MMIRKIKMTGRQTVPSPRIDEADEEGFIGFEQLRQGLTMRLPAFAGVPGRQVYFVVFSGAAEYLLRGVVENPEEDIVVPLPSYNAIELTGDSFTLQAFYLGDSVEKSPKIVYQAGAEAFAPSIDEAIEGGFDERLDGVIPWSVRAATVRIRPFENMAAGDRVRLHLLGTAPRGSETVVLEVEPDDVGRDITFTTSMLDHRAGKLHLVYEVEQRERTLTSLATIYGIEGPLGRVRPTYATGEDVTPLPYSLSLTYEGEEGCMPICVTLPQDASPGDQITFFMLPGRGPAMILRQAVGDIPAAEIRFCLPYDRMSRLRGVYVYIGWSLEYLTSGMGTVSSPISWYSVPWLK